MSLVSKFATVGGATLFSRLFGFGREMMMASALGIGPVADAFNLAFRFPNLFRRLFAEGAFNAAFIPLFARRLEEEGEEGARAFATEVFSTLLVVLASLTVVAMVFMPALTRTIIAPGLSACTDVALDAGNVARAISCEERFEITVAFSRIMFPYLACMSMMAMVSGILNAFRRFFAAAVAPTILNVVLIAVLAWCWKTGADKQTIGFLMSWGVLIAGIAQLLTVTVAMRMAGFGIALRRPRWTAGLKRLLILAAPAALIGGITQINLFVGQAIASYKPGAVSILQYADRPYQLPLGMVGVAIGVVLLPELARALKAGRLEEAQHTQNRSLEFALFLTVPAAIALYMIPEPIIRLIYERGAFDASTTVSVASVLGLYALGLPAFVMIKVFTPGYFAREDTRTPMVVTGASALANIVLSLLLFYWYAERGIALATTLAGWLNALLLFWGLRRKGLWQFDEGLVKRCTLVLVSAAAMGLALYGIEIALQPWIAPGSGVVPQALSLIALVMAAMAIYFALTLATGAVDRRLVTRLVKRKRG